MTNLLLELYNKFYTPLSMTAQRVEIYDCHHKLIDLLEKPERKLILTIMDRKDEIAEELALDSFIYSFKLALQLSTELNHYEELPLDRSRTLDDSVAVAILGQNKDDETPSLLLAYLFYIKAFSHGITSRLQILPLSGITHLNNQVPNRSAFNRSCKNRQTRCPCC